MWVVGVSRHSWLVGVSGHVGSWSKSSFVGGHPRFVSWRAVVVCGWLE
jgi:hypothetical protein